MSTQLTTSHSELPKMLRTSLIKGMEVFLLSILVFNNLKSTAGHLPLVNLQVINMIGDVWLVLFLLNMPSDTNLSICLSMKGLSPSDRGNGFTKKGNSSITLISAVKLGQTPISSLKLKASLYLRITFISFAFSFLVKAESFKSIFSNRISASDWNLLGSSSANQGYGSSLGSLGSHFCLKYFGVVLYHMIF